MYFISYVYLTPRTTPSPQHVLNNRSPRRNFPTIDLINIFTASRAKFDPSEQEETRSATVLARRGCLRCGSRRTRTRPSVTTRSLGGVCISPNQDTGLMWLSMDTPDKEDDV
jgi:hypothetical protein